MDFNVRRAIAAVIASRRRSTQPIKDHVARDLDVAHSAKEEAGRTSPHRAHQSHDYNALINALRRDGRMTLVGAPPVPAAIMGFGLIVSDVEVISVQKIDEAYERMLKGDVKYRFVIDIASLR